MIWDFTCPATLAPSHLQRIMFTAGAATSSIESRKIINYVDLGHAHSFIPVAIETLGVCDIVSQRVMIYNRLMCSEQTWSN